MNRPYRSMSTEAWRTMASHQLTAEARLVFVAMATSWDVKDNGVTPLALPRWSHLTGLSVEQVDAALDELAQCRYVLVDRQTAEVLVFAVRAWEKLTNAPAAVQLAGVISPAIRDALVPPKANRTRR